MLEEILRIVAGNNNIFENDGDLTITGNLARLRLIAVLNKSIELGLVSKANVNIEDEIDKILTDEK